jgi:hypothetical protein
VKASHLNERAFQRRCPNVFANSAGGAKECSPERSAAELRDRMASRPNPFLRVTEIGSLPGQSYRQDFRSLRRPFSGALSLGAIDPEFRYAPLRASIRRALQALNSTGG